MASDFLEAVGYGVLNDVLGAFRSNEGYAQPNRYEVIINPPQGQQLDNTYSTTNMANSRKLKQLSLRCESVNLPGQNISTADDTNIYGPVRQVAESVNYAEDIGLTFQASSGLEERDYFEDWHRRIYNEQNWNMQYYDTYVGSLEIYLLDRENKRRYGLKCWEAYPKTIGPIALSYGTNNEIARISVDFIFRYLTTLKISRKKQNIFGNIEENIVETAERKLTSNIPFSKLF